MRLKKGLLVGRGSADAGFGSLASMPVANRPLLEHAIETLADSGIEELAVVVEPAAREQMRSIVGGIEMDRLEVEICETPSEAGLEATLEAAIPVLGDEPFLLHLGDSLCWDLGLQSQSDSFGAADVLVLVQPAPAPAFSRSGESSDRGGPREAVRRPRFGHLGIYVVGQEFKASVAAVGRGRDLTADARAAVQVLAGNGGQAHYWRKPDSWRYTDHPRSLLAANTLALARLTAVEIPDGVTDTRTDGAVEIHPTATVEASVIRGPAIIGAGARITNAYVGPYTAVGRDVEIEGAEVEHSVIMRGASVRHVRERLEACIIGPHAQVFREFSLPRAMRVEVGAGAEVALA